MKTKFPSISPLLHQEGWASSLWTSQPPPNAEVSVDYEFCEKVGTIHLTVGKEEEERESDRGGDRVCAHINVPQVRLQICGF